MPTVKVKKRTGADAGTIDLPDAVFGIEPNTAVMHQVVTAQLAARRAGTQSTKTRAEVRGGGAKPWRQKGTGRARQGSTRSPQWRGGGVALGPKPRSYAQRTPKKMVRLALRSALSDRAADDKVIVVDELGFDAPKTKDAIALLDAVGATGRVLVVAPVDAPATWKSFRNLTHVHVVSPGELNAYDVLVSDVVVFTRDTVPTGEPAPKAAEAPAAPESAAPADEAEAAPVAPEADAPEDEADAAEAAAVVADADTDEADDEAGDEVTAAADEDEEE